VAGRDVRHGRRRGQRLALWLPVVVVLGVLAAAVVVWQVDGPAPDPAEQPAAVPPPPGLTLPPLPRPEPVAAEARGTADPALVRRAVAAILRDRDLGRHVLATVSAPDGTLLYTSGTGVVTPASTLKLLTATAALDTLGPAHTFDTTVVADGPRRVVLVGGGDPLLASRPDPEAYPRRADVVTLARAAAHELRAAGRTRVRVGYDTSLFSGPAVSPHWPPGYIEDGVVSPITSLWVDEGRAADGTGRVDDPAAAAATAFAAALTKAGVAVVGIPEPRNATAGATELARVSSAPLRQVVEHTIAYSDNEAAEVLSRHVGIATYGEGSFEAGARGSLQVLDALGVPTEGATVYDGSGLSRQDRLDPDTLTAVLEVAGSAAHPALRPVLTGLPVAGFTGSLTERFTVGDEAGRGMVRAKTGTLTNVSGLAGTVTDRDGNPMVFAFLADRIKVVDTLGARAALDAVTSALAACRCG
jgi:D-alanyl-D-alanine carboxypeptidase/D-alanyl-D-alanine-endopeptidase (penicillin-binding protein 4)